MNSKLTSSIQSKDCWPEPLRNSKASWISSQIASNQKAKSNLRNIVLKGLNTWWTRLQNQKRPDSHILLSILKIANSHSYISISLTSWINKSSLTTSPPTNMSDIFWTESLWKAMKSGQVRSVLWENSPSSSPTCRKTLLICWKGLFFFFFFFLNLAIFFF
jgi:hypothetical protein